MKFYKDSVIRLRVLVIVMFAALITMTILHYRGFKNFCELKEFTDGVLKRNEQLYNRVSAISDIDRQINYTVAIVYYLTDIKIDSLNENQTINIGKILHYCSIYDVNKTVALRLAYYESKWDSTAISTKGARGVFQIMPATNKFIEANGITDDIEKGIWYLNYLSNDAEITDADDINQWRSTISVYNSGYAEPRTKETRNLVNNVCK